MYNIADNVCRASKAGAAVQTVRLQCPRKMQGQVLKELRQEGRGQQCQTRGRDCNVAQRRHCQQCRAGDGGRVTSGERVRVYFQKK